MPPSSDPQSDAPETLEIQLLGPLRIATAGRALPPPRTAKGAVLLALLVCESAAVRRERLMTLLWPDAPADRADRSLRVALSDLRKIVGERIASPAGSLDFVALPGDRIDVLTLLEWQAGRLTDTTELAERLPEGEELLQGLRVPKAPELETWLATERSRWAHLRLRAEIALAEGLAASGAPGEAETHLRRALRHAPEREAAQRTLIRLLGRQGRYDEALAQLEACREALDRRLGVMPAMATTALGERIVAARRRGAVAPRPRPSGRFVGRKDELARLERWLAAPERFLVSILGPGGIGKTRLAEELARRAESRYLEGVCFVALAGAAADEPLEPVIARALGLSVAGAKSPRERLLQALSEREMLLVLDNVEHLADPRPLLSAILETAPEVDLLVTSREAVGLPAERRMPLSGLTLPEEAVAPSGDGPADAIALFAAAAHRVDPEFDLSTHEPSAARICRMLAGSPLALELAAAWLDTLDCSALADAIEEDLDMLATTAEGRPERHRGLRAVFEHSWARLTPGERLALARLSVFRGGFDRAAAKAVADADAATLRRLTLKSLIQRGAGERWQVHELLRHYAHEHVLEAAGAHRDLARRHAHHYLEAFARRAARRLGPEATEVVSAIERDRDNLLAAWRWAVEDGDHEAIAPAVVGLADYAFDLGPNALGREVCGDALALLPDGTDSGSAKAVLRAAVLAARARLRHQAGRREEAREDLDAAIALVPDAPGDEPAARAFSLRGVLHREEGAYDEALADFDTAIHRAERAGAERLAAEAAYQRAGVAVYQGDAERTLTDTRAVLERVAGRDWPRLESSMYFTLGAILEQQGRTAEASAAMRSCLERAQESGFRLGEMHGRLGLGVIDSNGERLHEGMAHIDAALGLADAMGHRIAERNVRCSAALTCAWLGRRAEAEFHARRAVEQSRADGHRRDEATALQRLARVQRMAHAYVEADENARASIALYGAVGEQGPLAWLHMERGWIAVGAGDLVGARKELDEALALLDEHRPGTDLHFTLLYHAHLSWAEGDEDDAAERIEALLPKVRMAGHVEIEASARTLAAWLRLREDPSAAAAAFEAALALRDGRGQAHLRVEPAIGLARARLLMDDQVAARELVEPCVATVVARRFFGIPTPTVLTLSLTDTLSAWADPRAEEVARAGLRWLAARASTFALVEARERFEHGNPARRALRAR